jgi:hypothetical protein
VKVLGGGGREKRRRSVRLPLRRSVTMFQEVDTGGGRRRGEDVIIRGETEAKEEEGKEG